jgi:hypothetical protein
MLFERKYSIIKGFLIINMNMRIWNVITRNNKSCKITLMKSKALDLFLLSLQP